MQFKVGMVFMIELMINMGKVYVKEFKDGWIVVIVDKFLIVQWEYMVFVIEIGFELLLFWFEGMGIYLEI